MIKRFAIFNLLTFTLLFQQVTFAQGNVLDGVNQDIQIRELYMPELLSDLSKYKIITNPGDIIYGNHNPSANSKTVVVFVHGKGGNGTNWFYSQMGVSNRWDSVMRNENLRFCFVSLHPDENQRTNGQLLAAQLNTICAHYGANKVIVLAHSKGGLDTDAAINLYGARPKVKQVITMSSPHLGSKMADLVFSTNPMINAMINAIGDLGFFSGTLNPATLCLTKANMAEFRTGNSYSWSGIDNKVGVGLVPFITQGAKGYYNSPYSSAKIKAAGLILKGMEGDNDCLVAYTASKRTAPGTLNIPYTPWANSYNHNDIRCTGNQRNVWPYIKSYFPKTGVSKLFQDPADSNYESFDENVIEDVVHNQSNWQTYNTINNEYNFYVSKNVSSCNLTVALNKDNKTPIELFKIENGALIAINFELTTEENISTLLIKNPGEGNYLIKSTEQFPLIINYEGSPAVVLTANNKVFDYSIKANEKNSFELNLLSENKDVTLSSAVASVYRVASFEEIQPSKEVKHIIFSKNNTGSLIAENLVFNKDGIYELEIQIKYSDGSERTFINTLGVTPNNMSLALTENIKDDLFHFYPNPINNELNINLSNNLLNTTTYVSITDILGRVIISNVVKTPIHTLNLSLIEKGTYIINIEQGENKQTKMFVKE